MLGLLLRRGYTKSINTITFSKNEKKDKKQFPKVLMLSTNTLDNDLAYVLKKYTNADMMSIRLKKDEKEQDIQIRLEKKKVSPSIWCYFKTSDGQITEIRESVNQPIGYKITGMNYDIHTGGIGGILTRILAFIATLISASLPIIGCIVWYNKRPNKKKK